MGITADQRYMVKNKFFAFVLIAFGLIFSVEIGFTKSGDLACRTSLKAALHGIFYDEEGHILSATALNDRSMVIDSNLLISYDMVKRGGAEARHERWYGFLIKQKKTAKKHGENFHLWLTNRTAKEVTIASHRNQIPPGARLVPISTSRDSDEYKSVLNQMEAMKVGENKPSSYKDREIVADLFFAKRRSENTIPSFATADNGIIKPLCKLNPMCAKLNNNKIFIREKFPDGFEVTITDANGKRRTIRIIPV